MAAMFSAELSFRTMELGGEAALRSARHVLHLDCSHGPSSLIAHGATALFAELGRRRPDLKVEHLRLWESDTRARMEYSLDHVRSKMAMLAGGSEPADTKRFASIEALAVQVATARGLVVSAPMWNYSVPWVLKQYFDCVLHPGLTFCETPAGPRGLLGGGRPLVIITSSGGAGKKDYLAPWLQDVAGMIGFDNTKVVAAPNAAHADRVELLEQVAASASQAADILSGEGASSTPQAQPPQAAESAAAAAGGAPAEDEQQPPVEWDSARVLQWLRSKGGLSQDALESLEAVKVSGELLFGASEDDWQDDELGLEDQDVARMIELQKIFRSLVN